MLNAFDANLRTIVSADKAVKDHSYYCTNEFCKAKLVLRKSEKITPHFAHYPGTSENGTPEQRACVAEDIARHANDLSPWKQKWSEGFPLEAQNRVVKHRDKYKFADVRFDSSMTTLQFQHTRLRQGEFDKRNAHFTGAGYRSVWVFDGAQVSKKLAKIPLYQLSEEQQKVAKETRQYYFNFSDYDKFFGDYDPELEPNILVYLTFPAKDGTEYLYRICWVSPFKHEKFAAVYTPYRDFLHDCQSTKPLNAEDAEKKSAAVLKNALSARKNGCKTTISPLDAVNAALQ